MRNVLDIHIVILFGLIFLLLPWHSYSQKNKYSVSKGDSSVLYSCDAKITRFYLHNKDKVIKYPCNLIPLSDQPMNNRENAIYHLVQGDCFQFGLNADKENAYASYLESLQYAEKSGSEVLQCEVYKRLINYCIYSKSNKREADEFIMRHAQLVYNRREELHNDFLKLKLQFENTYLDNLPNENNEDWLSLIQNASKEGLARLESSVRGVYAIVLEKDEKPQKALMQFAETLKLAKLVYPEKSNIVFFRTYANMGALELGLKHYRKSIAYLNISRNYNFQEQNERAKSLIYSWLAENYKNINQSDSAYHYMSLAFEAHKNNKQEEQSVAVKEIQSKYDNERLKREKKEMEYKVNNRQYWIIILGLFLFLFATLGLYNYQIYKYRNKVLVEKSKYMAELSATTARMDGEQEERKLIASTLHDKIASLLTAVDMHFKVVKILGNKQQQSSINKASSILREVNNEVRDISHRLASPVLMKFGLAMALDSLCQKMDSNQLHIRFDTNVEKQRFDPKLERFLYRASSELLNNVLKHSKATEASVRFVYKNEELSIRVTDNGIGIDKDTKIEGMGLDTICTRSKAFQGYCHVQNPRVGTCIEIIIPNRNTAMNSIGYTKNK